MSILRLRCLLGRRIVSDRKLLAVTLSGEPGFRNPEAYELIERAGCAILSLRLWAALPVLPSNSWVPDRVAMLTTAPELWPTER